MEIQLKDFTFMFNKNDDDFSLTFTHSIVENFTNYSFKKENLREKWSTLTIWL